MILLLKQLWSKVFTLKEDPETLEMLRGICAQYGVPFNLAAAIIDTESSWRERAYNPPSPSNALASYGLMQITLMVAQDFGLVEDWTNPTQAEIEKVYDRYNNMLAGVGNFSKFYYRYKLEVAIQMNNVGERGYNELGWRNSDYLAKVLGHLQERGGLNV